MKAVVLALESNEETEDSIVKLLKYFSTSIMVTPDQMKNVTFFFPTSSHNLQSIRFLV